MKRVERTTSAADGVPTVSVVMPVHNAARYVGKAMWSMRRQTLSEIEIVVVDDGSTDRSAAVLDRHAKHDPRVQVVRQTNQGLVPALNAGLAAARGPYIARMDADDVAWPSRLAKQVAHLEANPGCVAVGGWVRMIEPGGWPVGYRKPVTNHAAIDAGLLKGGGHLIPHPTVMIRRETVMQLDGYRSGIQPGDDLDLYLRLAEVGTLANLPEVVLDYRLHLNNTSKTMAVEGAACARQAVADACERRGLAMPEPPGASAEMQPRTLADLRESWWWHARHNGFFSSALRQSAALLGRRPWQIGRWKQAAGDTKRLLREGAHRRETQPAILDGSTTQGAAT